MTAYNDFIKDFPTRCSELLNTHFDQAKATDREVTLMLAIASAAFVIPFERLRPQPTDHPANDVGKYDKAKQIFDKAINSRFRLSHRWGQGKSWQTIESVAGRIVRDMHVDYWARNEIRKPLAKDTIANTVFSRIRNALSHGSIFTFPANTRKDVLAQIETIIFASRCYEWQEIEKCGKKTRENVPVDKFHLLLVSPDDLRMFLEKWVEFLGSLDLSSGTALQASNAAHVKLGQTNGLLNEDTDTIRH